MRFALLGNRADGVEMARALIASGRHTLLYHATAATDPGPRWPDGARRAADLEEVLADPAVEMVLVASGPAHRAAHLRRAMQSERDVVCVHPPDARTDTGYELDMIRQDVRRGLVPLLPDAFHPGIVRLRDFVVRAPGDRAPPASTPQVPRLPDREGASPHGIVTGPAAETKAVVSEMVMAMSERVTPLLGELRLVEVERRSTGEVLLNTEAAGELPCFPGWDVLRALGGEVAEVSVLTPGEAVEAGAPVLVAGRFERGGMFQQTLLPHQPEGRLRLRLVGSAGEAELLFPLGVPGPAFLTWRDGGEPCEEAWDDWDPWPRMVELVEEALAAGQRGRGAQPGVRLTWDDEVRCLELDDAARRSAHRRRSSTLEYAEASEEVGFKGTMTLVGCGLLWAIILLVILSRGVPWLGWAVAPLLGVFLLLQLLRWVIPPREGKGDRR